jgi:hypothetical protein
MNDFYAFVYDGATYSVYVDGSPSGFSYSAPEINFADLALSIGFRVDTGTYTSTMTGPVRICNTARSGSWIADEYASQQPADSHDLALWNYMNDGAGNVLVSNLGAFAWAPTLVGTPAYGEATVDSNSFGTMTTDGSSNYAILGF